MQNRVNAVNVIPARRNFFMRHPVLIASAGIALVAYLYQCAVDEKTQQTGMAGVVQAGLNMSISLLGSLNTWWTLRRERQAIAAEKAKLEKILPAITLLLEDESSLFDPFISPLPYCRPVLANMMDNYRTKFVHAEHYAVYTALLLSEGNFGIISKALRINNFDRLRPAWCQI